MDKPLPLYRNLSGSLAPETTSVAHGLSLAKIIGVLVLTGDIGANMYGPGYSSVRGNKFRVDATNVVISDYDSESVSEYQILIFHLP